MLALLIACAEPPPPAPAVHELRGDALGTSWLIKWKGSTPPNAVAAVARTTLADIDARMSTWRDDSELQAVRRGEGPIGVSEETFAVVDAALDLAEATGGAFDPTVEPLMELWGFRGEKRTEPPTQAEIDTIRKQVGWDKVQLGRGPDGAPWIDAGGTALDLSAIAKGHAVDRVSHAVSALGATDHMVEIGGEVRAHGQGPSGAWRLGVDKPDASGQPGESVAAVVELRNAALATSGNYRNAYDAGGVRLVHTMDPRLGRPHESTVASASVIAPDCRTADGWATALMVLTPEVGEKLVEARPELEALWLLTGPDGSTEQRSSGLDAFVPPAR